MTTTLKYRRRRSRPKCGWVILMIAAILLLLESIEAANYNGYNYNRNYGDDDDGSNNGGDDDDGGGGNNNDDQGGGGDDDYYNDDDANANAANNGNDDAQQGDDDYNYNYQYNNNNNGNGGGDDDAYNKYVDDWASNQVANDDDLFHWNSNVGFEGVSVMPVSCIN